MPDDDVLEVAPRRRVPRWLALLLALAVVGAGIGMLTTRGGGSKRPAGSPGAASSPLIIKQLGGTDDLAIIGTRLFRLANGALYRDDIDGSQLDPDGVLTIEGLDLTQRGTSYHLVPDAAHARLYVVSFGESPATVIQVDTARLQQQNLAYWPSQVSAATVLDGTLYLAATNAVAAFAPWARAGRQVDALPGQYQDLVADPVRHRLLLFGFESDQQRFVAWTPAGGALVRAPAPFGKGALAVAAGQIWAGGFGNAGPVLSRLDPGTLRAAAASPLAPQLGPGVLLVGAGASDLWVRSGNADDDGLWCVDARSGADLQSWHYTGPVASTAGAAYLGASGGTVRLDLRGCRG